MFEEFKKGMKTSNPNVGVLEYIFGILAGLSVLPVVVVYLVLAKLIVQPLIKVKKKIWK